MVNIITWLLHALKCLVDPYVKQGANVAGLTDFKQWQYLIPCVEDSLAYVTQHRRVLTISFLVLRISFL